MIKVILLTDIGEAYGTNLLKGITRYSQKHGPWVFCRMPGYYRETKGIKGILKWAKEWEANGIIVPPMCVSGTNMGMHGIWACWVESQPSEKSEEKTSSLDQLQGLPATKNHSQLAASWLFRMPLAERIPILLAEFS